MIRRLAEMKTEICIKVLITVIAPCCTTYRWRTVDNEEARATTVKSDPAASGTYPPRPRQRHQYRFHRRDCRHRISRRRSGTVGIVGHSTSLGTVVTLAGLISSSSRSAMT
jgi:hypothetical protein